MSHRSNDASWQLRKTRTNEIPNQQEVINNKDQSRNPWYRNIKKNTKDQQSKKLVFWEGKQNRQTCSQTNTKEKKLNKIRDEKGDITPDIAEIQRIIRNYCEELHANQLENLEGMDKFLYSYNPARLSQAEINNLNRPVTSSSIEAVIKSLPLGKCLEPDGFTIEFYKTFRGSNSSTVQTTPKYWTEWNSAKLFLRPTLLWYQSQTKIWHKKKTTDLCL